MGSMDGILVGPGSEGEADTQVCLADIWSLEVP